MHNEVPPPPNMRGRGRGGNIRGRGRGRGGFGGNHGGYMNAGEMLPAPRPDSFHSKCTTNYPNTNRQINPR